MMLDRSSDVILAIIVDYANDSVYRYVFEYSLYDVITGIYADLEQRKSELTDGQDLPPDVARALIQILGSPTDPRQYNAAVGLVRLALGTTEITPAAISQVRAIAVRLDIHTHDVATRSTFLRYARC